MWSCKDLMRSLTKVVYDVDRGNSLDLILDIVEVDCSRVREVMENVGRFDCKLSSLSISENKIHPFVQMLTHILAFKGFAMLRNEDFWIAMRPWRKFDGIYNFARTLSKPKVKSIRVHQKL